MGRADTPMSDRGHFKGGEFQSDKYPTCPAGKVPLSTKDPMAQDLLWEYAWRRRAVDPDFADDLQAALRQKGFSPMARSIETIVIFVSVLGVIVVAYCIGAVR